MIIVALSPLHRCQIAESFDPDAATLLLCMEGDLSKKSIHINESFVHAIYIGIVVNSYSDIVAYILIHTIDKFMYGFEKCLLLVCVCIIKRANTYASY